MQENDIGMFSLNCFNTTSDFILISWEVYEKMQKMDLLYTDLMTSGQEYDHRQWQKMVVVNGAYQHNRCERSWLKSLHIMLKAKLFATQDKLTDGQMDKASLLNKHPLLYRSIIMLLKQDMFL